MWWHGDHAGEGSANGSWTHCASCGWWGYDDQIIESGGVCGGCQAPLRTGHLSRRVGDRLSGREVLAAQVLAFADALPEDQRDAVVAALTSPAVPQQLVVLETGAVSARDKFRAAQRAVKTAQDAAVRAKDAADAAVAVLAQALAVEEQAQIDFAEETKLLEQHASMDVQPPAPLESRIQLSDLLTGDGEKRISIDMGATLDPDSPEFAPEDRERLKSLQREQEEAIAKLLHESVKSLNEQVETIKAEFSSKSESKQKKSKAQDGEPLAVGVLSVPPDNRVALHGANRPAADGTKAGAATAANGRVSAIEPEKDKAEGDSGLDRKRAPAMQAVQQQQQAKGQQPAAHSAAAQTSRTPTTVGG